MYYHKLGKIPRKRHIVFKKEDGSLYREQLMGLQGFSGPSSLLYKENLPTATSSMKKLAIGDQEGSEISTSFTNWHFKTAALSTDESFFQSRVPLLKNPQVEIGVSTFSSNSILRNASHHELHFLHSGEGQLRSEFGTLNLHSGDYIYIPKGITHQWDFEGDVRVLLTQSLQPMEFPSRYLGATGQFLEHSPVCERDIRVPETLEPCLEKGDFRILVHRSGEYFEQVLDHHPFDTVGWDGYLYPFAISIHDFEPLVGRIHQPPPIHQIFNSAHFVVCNFVPRLFDFHPEAIPAPYFHSNTDSDEVLYYVDGEFMSRKGIEQGSITLHPAGIPHGPQPGKTEASVGVHETVELAVMIDTFEPLMVTDKALGIQQEDYVRSWLEQE
jgi:homogentisate 1,2-dioxygenase